jgi:hypothetical protein
MKCITNIEDKIIIKCEKKPTDEERLRILYNTI